MGVDTLRTPTVENLLNAIASTGDADAAWALVCDVCTVREIDEMARRLEVARLLDEGQSYLAIQEATGASATTVSRVSKCLAMGAGGYRSALDALAAQSTEPAAPTEPPAPTEPATRTAPAAPTESATETRGGE